MRVKYQIYKIVHYILQLCSSLVKQDCENKSDNNDFVYIHKYLSNKLPTYPH